MTILTREQLNTLMDRISLTAGRGSVSQSYYDQLSGINMLNIHPTIPMAKERSGLTFWTRPKLNLNDANLRAWPQLYDMIADKTRMSLLSVVRALLDPVGCWEGDRNSPLIDNFSPFIPWLSNSLISQSGWPETLVGTFTSPEGNHHEAYTMIDDTIKNYRVWALNCSNRNMPGNFIGMLLYTWVAAASLQFEGDMIPYPDSIRGRRRNYHSRVFRFSTDEKMQRIEEWWSTIVYPYMAPTSVNANSSIDNPYNLENQQVSISWQATGCDTYNPQVLTDFNRISIYFNPYLHPKVRDAHMVKVDVADWPRYNYKCYMLINADTKEFERYVHKDVYNKINETLMSRIFMPENVTQNVQPIPGATPQIIT